MTVTVDAAVTRDSNDVRLAGHFTVDRPTLQMPSHSQWREKKPSRARLPYSCAQVGAVPRPRLVIADSVWPVEQQCLSQFLLQMHCQQPAHLRGRAAPWKL